MTSQKIHVQLRGMPIQNRTQSIKMLAPDVAEKIAAGEVIERPSSIVKELIENAIDARATQIQVKTEQGGRALIEILDNGIGMGKEDLALCTERHATSKLKEFDDLLSLSSMGFRGEALPSISAVSELEIVTRSKFDTTAHEWKSQSVKATTFGHFLGSDTGTRVRVSNLFSEIPARLKFLKSPRSETSQIKEWMERLSLAYPSVGFQFINEEKKILDLPPQDARERVRKILCDNGDYTIVEEALRHEGLSTKAYWIQGLSLPHARKTVQVINNRAVRDRFVQQAILSPFRQLLLPGRFPALFLSIEINPSEIDVNVHPAKAEVRFADNQHVFQLVQKTFQKMIDRHGAPVSGVAASGEQFSQSSSERQFQPRPTQFTFREPGTINQLANSLALSESHEVFQEESEDSSVGFHPFSEGRYVGSVFSTYIIYDLGEQLGLVDHHAAHERIRFELLKKSVFENFKLETQALLIPEAVPVSEDERENLSGRLPWLSKMGFEAEIFGYDSILFRAIPGPWGTDNLRPRLKNLVSRLLTIEASETSSSSDTLFDEALFEKLASEACRSSRRGGDLLSQLESETLIKELFNCENPWNCPHGRPTVVKIPRLRFEQWFQRKL